MLDEKKIHVWYLLKWSYLSSFQFFVKIAAGLMTFDRAHAAEKRNANCGAEKTVTAFFKVAAERIAIGKTVHIGNEAALLWELRHVQPCVVDGCVYLTAVADDAAVLHKPFCILLCHERDLTRVETAKRVAQGFPFVQHGAPRKPRLKALEAQLFKQLYIVVFSFAEFGVMVNAHQLIAAAGPAASIHGLSLSQTQKTVNLFYRLC